MHRRLAAALLLAPVALPAQSRSAELLQAARQHIAANRLDSADAELRAALESAGYLMDSVNILVWRGVLEHVRGSDSLARVSFRRALKLNAGISVRGLDQISPGLGELFEDEAPEMQALRVGGTVIVEASLDTTGRVVPATLKVVQSPNPMFDAEARRVVAAATYRPARLGGRAVRTTIRQPITFAPY